MFGNMVTLFNFSEKENKYYTTIFENAEFQPNYKTRFTPDSTEGSSHCLLIVKYEKNPLGKFILEDGIQKYFLSSKKWQTLEFGEKPGYFTLNAGQDFFIKGNAPENYETYEEVKNGYDDVFFVHSVKDFEDDLPHFEIEGF